MTIQYHSNVFHGGVVPIGDASWRRNIFKGVKLIVNGLPADFAENDLDDTCQFEFLPNGVTPLQLADFLQTRQPRIAVVLRNAVAKGEWKAPALN